MEILKQEIDWIQKLERHLMWGWTCVEGDSDELSSNTVNKQDPAGQWMRH